MSAAKCTFGVHESPMEYKTGLIGSAIIGGAIASYCYGSYSDDFLGYAILAVTGASSGIAFWVLYMNDHLGNFNR